eukprot:10916092-Ditylum_brightwellii.AAC.1
MAAAINGSTQKHSSSTTDTNATTNKANTLPEPKPYQKNQALDGRYISRMDQAWHMQGILIHLILEVV